LQTAAAYSAGTSPNGTCGPVSSKAADDPQAPTPNAIAAAHRTVVSQQESFQARIFFKLSSECGIKVVPQTASCMPSALRRYSRSFLSQPTCRRVLAALECSRPIVTRGSLVLVAA